MNLLRWFVHWKWGMPMLLLLALALSVPFALSAEVTFTPEELADLKGPAGPQGPAGAQGPAGPEGDPGAPGTRITELLGICYFDIGGEEFQIPCTPSEDVVEPPEPEVPAGPEPPTEGGSHINAAGRATLVWIAPTERTDGSPLGPISRYRVNSRGTGEDWTFSGDTTTVKIRLTQSGCYRVRAIVEGLPWSDFSNEVCLK